MRRKLQFALVAARARNSLLVQRSERVSTSRPILQESIKTDYLRDCFPDPDQTHTVNKTGYDESFRKKTAPKFTDLRLTWTI
jgi:hypothetical protein